MKNDKTVFELQIKGLQDHIVELYQDQNELMNELFIKEEQVEELQIQNQNLQINNEKLIKQ